MGLHGGERVHPRRGGPARQLTRTGVAAMSAAGAGRGDPATVVLPTSPLLERVRRGLLGEGELMDGPFGPRRVTYADYTASGRSLDFIEDFVRDTVLPWYANTHTESSGT